MTKGIKGFQKGHAIFNGSEKSWFKKGESFWKGKKRDEKTRKKISENLNGIIPWNKGLTKEIDKRVKDNAEKTGKTLHRLYEEGKLKTNSEYMKRLYKEGIFINPMKGRHHKEETKRKMSESKKGEKAYNWMGGISFEPYSSNFNKLFKKAIKIRDNACMICGSNNRLSIHHIDYNKLNTIKENCVCLCNSCHTKTNFNREHWTKFFQSLMKERYGYDYINLIGIKL